MPRRMKRESVFADEALQAYLNDISKFQPLSREEESELGKRAQNGDIKARDKLIQANLKFVVKIAAQYQNRGLPLSELISEGNIGLMKAIEKFEPDKDIKLISYAIWWIRQRILSAVSEKSSSIRVPLGKAGTAHRIRSAEDRIYVETGRSATTQEVAERLNMNEKAVEMIKEQMPDTSSYDEVMQTSSYDSFSTRDLLMDKYTVDPQQLYYQEKMSDRLNRAINSLEQREAQIIRTYYGLNENRETRNFAQIAEMMGLSRERVRQIQKEALKKILAEMQPEEDAYVDDFINKYDYS